MTELEMQGKNAAAASKSLMVCGTKKKNEALFAIARALRDNADGILAENAVDVAAARENGMAEAMLDRLTLTKSRIEGMADGVEAVAALGDPTSEAETFTRPNGLIITKRRVPLGVIAIIYEARPNVTSDAAALCLKSGNAVILRGGKEAFRTNSRVTGIMRNAIAEVGLPEDCINMVHDTSRETANELMCLSEYIDLLIPRGGAGLIKSVVKNARVPVIETGIGNCHVYVEKSADLNMAADILYNAKCSRPSVCNAAETLLVDVEIAESFLPMAKKRLDDKNVEIRGCARTAEILGSSVIPATDEDYLTEYDDYIISVKVVSGLDEAIGHINRCGTGHSEAIVTNDYAASMRFLDEIDAAAVYVNASTRFTDGGEFGFGAEIGISTQKMHARGPMGLRELTSCKYAVLGNGQIR